MYWKFKTVYLAYLLHLEDIKMHAVMIEIINTSFLGSNIYILFYELFLTSNIPFYPYVFVYVN